MAERNFRIVNMTSADIILTMTTTHKEARAQATFLNAEGKPQVLVNEVDVVNFTDKVTIPASEPNKGRGVFGVDPRASKPKEGSVVLSPADFDRLKAEPSYKAALDAEPKLFKVERTEDEPGTYAADAR